VDGTSAAALGRTHDCEAIMNTNDSNIRIEDLRDFHDAELASLALDRAAGRVDLLFSRVDGTRARFECEGVVNIKCSTLLFQNVVSRILVTPTIALKVEEVRQIVAWSLTLDSKMAISQGTLDTHVDNVMAGTRKLLHVDPSWGAELAVLCESVVLKST
jgi:hypothetical protein